MAVDKLALYNNALLLIGQRSLANITENRPPRFLLDGAYDLDAVQYCLEIVQPQFATKIIALNSPTPSGEHGLDSVHELPADYIKVVKVFSDDKLDQEVNRYLIEGKSVVTEHAVIYVRYVSNDKVAVFDDWTPSFTRVVAAYLAREISVKAAPDEYLKIEQLFLDRVEAARGLEQESEPDVRPSSPITTLSNEWLRIYNDALLILGLDEISSANDDSNRRSKLDRAVDAGVVSNMLEDTGWTFAVTSTKIEFDPSVEPSWGYRYAFAKPSKLHRIVGLFGDEHMQSPLKNYQDESGYFFADVDEIYFQFISTDFLTNPSQWPVFFKRLIASRLAKDASAALMKEGADPKRADIEHDSRRNSAMSNDAMSSPPRRIQSGSWVNSRYRGGNRNRPGDY